MTILEMLKESAALAGLGISVVFSFLILIVIFITLAGKIINAFDSGKNVKPKDTKLQDTKLAETTVKEEKNDSVIAAITAAVNEYRKGISG